MWGRASAGVIAGFFLAAALDGLVCWALPGPWSATLVPGLLAFFPLWTAIFCLSLRFPSGTRAWAWLAPLAVALLAALRAGQASGWIE